MKALNTHLGFYLRSKAGRFTYLVAFRFALNSWTEDRSSVGSTLERRKRASSSPLDWHHQYILWKAGIGEFTWIWVALTLLGSKEKYPFYPPKGPRWLDQLRPGMSEYEFWETLGLIELKVWRGD